ncbi:MAG: aminoacyl-tRNA hydrolase [Mariprofundaceae bacterium]
MKLLVGLGNPDSKYLETRHNVGFRFLDQIAKSEGLKFSLAPRFHAETATWHSNHGKILLIKPMTYMNNSGESIAPLSRYYNIDAKEIIVIYDDLDLPSGKIRIKTGGGHGGHNGLRSLNLHLDQSDYTRIKVGIGRPQNGDITAWVLGRACENDRIDEARVFDALEDQLGSIIKGQTDTAANHIHLKLNPS